MTLGTVGGRPFDFSREEIEGRVKNIPPEPIREHLVEILDTVYPPKQVLALVTGWDRTTFTTMEALRVLSRAGFICHRATEGDQGARSRLREEPDHEDEPADVTGGPERRLARLEASLAVTQAAVASLVGRVEKLEALVR